MTPVETDAGDPPGDGRLPPLPIGRLAGPHAARGRRPAAVPLRWASSRATSRPRRGRWWRANQAQVLGRRPGDPLVRAATREAFDSLRPVLVRLVPLRGHAARGGARRGSRPIGDDHLWHALDGGQGAIVALPHVGNWDAAGPWLSALGRPVVAVAEQLRPPRLYELFVANRTAFGVDVIGLGDEGVARTLAKRLADGVDRRARRRPRPHRARGRGDDVRSHPAAAGRSRPAVAHDRGAADRDAGVPDRATGGGSS